MRETISGLSGTSIFVVEDEAIVALDLQTMLEDAGLTLGDVNVGHSDQGSRQSRFDGERRIADGGTMAREDVSPSHRVAADRLVDVRV